MVGLAIDSVDYCCTACKLLDFKNVIWTFSGGSSTDERSVVQQFDHRKATPVLCPRKLREYALTSGLAPGIGSSYVVYYLSMRVSDWWGPLASLGAIWAGGVYRAFVARNFLVSTDDSVGTNEH